MKYRRLGRTEAEVPIIIFGCGNVGGLMIHSDEDTMHAAASRAIEAGINWFDTAESYGQGKSEENLGRVLKNIDAPTRVSTKVRLQPDKLDDIPGDIERHVTASLERLQRDQVELLQLHNGLEPDVSPRSMTRDQVLGSGGALEALEKLRDQGLCKWIGFTALGDNALCQEVINSGRVDTAQVYFNMINPSAAVDGGDLATGQSFFGLLECCRQNDVGVIAIRALAAGVLASKERHGREMIITADTDLAKEEQSAETIFDMLGTTYGTRAQSALRFVWSDPRVSCIDFAPGELAHLEEALGAVELGPMSADDLIAIQKATLNHG